MKLALCLALIPFLVSCVTASVTSLTSTYRPPTDPSQITIYLDARDIPGPFEKIGLINARGDSSFTNESMMLAKGRKEAAKLGANGLLLRGIDEASQGAKIAAELFGTTTNRRGEMIAVYVYPQTPGTSQRLSAEASSEPRKQSFEEWLQDQEDSTSTGQF